MSRRGFSIERIVLLMQSNRRLVRLLHRALGFGVGGGANDEFAFYFRHPEKVSQPVEVGLDRYGFELGDHVGDVAGDDERSLRSRRSALSGSPISGFVSREA